jgi:hypothetical protein
MALQPINYSNDVASPFEGFLAGQKAELGNQSAQANIAGQQLQNQAAQFNLAQAQQQAQLQQRQQQRQQAYIQAIQGLGAAPTAEQYLGVNQQFPDFAKQTGDLSAQWGAERTKNETLAGVQYLRVLNTDPVQAASLADDRAKASANAGDPMMAQYWRAHADEARKLGSLSDPAQRNQVADHIRNATLLQIAAVNPKGFDDIYKGLKAPGEIAKSEVEPLKIAQDIETEKAKNHIALLDTQIKQTDSETKRGELQLEREKLQASLDQKKQAQGETAQVALDTTTQALGTVKSLLDHPGLSAATGTGGGFRSFFASSDGADFRAMVDTLKSQQFLAAVSQLKGTGATAGGLTDAEGTRIEKAVANLDPSKQSTESFKTSLNVIRATLEKAQQRAILNAPTSGGAFVMQLPGGRNVTEGDVNRAMKAHPGATRDQALLFLSLQKGGQP